MIPLYGSINRGSQKGSSLPKASRPLGGRASLGIGGPDSRAPARAFHGVHVSVPKAEKAPWKAASSQAPGSACILATRFPGFQRQPGRDRTGCGSLAPARALSIGRVTLQRGRRRVAAPDAAAVMVTSASAIGPARPHYVALWAPGGEARERPPLLRMLREQSGRRLPPALPSSARSATPDVREGKSPRWSQVAARPTPPANLATMVTGPLRRLLGTV